MKLAHSREILKMTWTIAFALMAAALVACSSPDPDVLRLPDPAWVCPRPELDAVQQPKQDDADEAIYKRYEALGWKVVESKQTPLCAIIDCIDNSSFPPEAWAQPPAPPTPEQMMLPPGVGLMLAEIDVYPYLQCRPGSTPVDRPSYSGYVFRDTGATSLQDWLDNYPEVVGAPPPTPDRLYAGLGTTVVNKGANTWVNTFNSGEPEPETVSILEMAVGCSDAFAGDGAPGDWQQVGIAARRDGTKEARAMTGDTELRLGIEFISLGEGIVGPLKGGWAQGKSSTDDFINRPNAPYYPGLTFDPSTTSTVGGPQFEAFFQIKFEDGKWWVGLNGHWLGYYRTDLFNKGGDRPKLTSNACNATFYVELADNRKDKTIPASTALGSAEFADAGFGRAAYFRDPSYVDINGITWYWPDMGPSSGAPPVMTYSDQWQVPPGAKPQYNPACYTFVPLTSGPPRIIYVGGPGCK